MANSIWDIAGAVAGAQVEPATGVPSASVPNAPASSNDNGLQAPSGDHTALSALADTIQEVIRQASSLSSFRPELVAQLKSAIANQSYNPQPEQVAARIAAAIGKH
jgi:anti-sigma28 factor (negative regulator of flagellin synthesis)